MLTLQRFTNRLSLTVTSFTAFFWSTIAQAQDFLGDVPDIGGGPVGEDALRDTILDVLSAVLNFMALVAVVVIVIAGIRLVVAGAEDQQREKAKKMIIYTIVGLIIIILASAIVSFVATTLTG